MDGPELVEGSVPDSLEWIPALFLFVTESYVPRSSWTPKEVFARKLRASAMAVPDRCMGDDSAAVSSTDRSCLNDEDRHDQKPTGTNAVNDRPIDRPTGTDTICRAPRAPELPQQRK